MDRERPGPAHRWADRPRTAARAVADRDELERAFRRLPIDQRAVFVLHHYLGLPLVEIAEMLGDPRGHGPIAPALRHAGAPRRPRRPSASPLSTEDVSHDRRPLARTRRSVVARGRPDPGARPRRRGRPPPHRNDTTRAGSPDPVEVPDHAHPRPRRGSRRHRRAAGRRRVLCRQQTRPALRGGARPVTESGSHAVAVTGRHHRPAPDGTSGDWQAELDTPLTGRCRRQRPHPALDRLAEWRQLVDPDRRRRPDPPERLDDRSSRRDRLQRLGREHRLSEGATSVAIRWTARPTACI